jgi:hypothetical protein
MLLDDVCRTNIEKISINNSRGKKVVTATFFDGTTFSCPAKGTTIQIYLGGIKNAKTK